MRKNKYHVYLTAEEMRTVVKALFRYKSYTTNSLVLFTTPKLR